MGVLGRCFWNTTVLALGFGLTACGDKPEPAEAPKPVATAATPAEPTPVTETSASLARDTMPLIKPSIADSNYNCSENIGDGKAASYKLAVAFYKVGETPVTPVQITLVNPPEKDACDLNVPIHHALCGSENGWEIIESDKVETEEGSGLLRSDGRLSTAGLKLKWNSAENILTVIQYKNPNILTCVPS